MKNLFAGLVVPLILVLGAGFVTYLFCGSVWVSAVFCLVLVLFVPKVRSVWPQNLTGSFQAFRILILVFFLALFIKNYLAVIRVIPTSSMEHTVMAGQMVLMNKRINPDNRFFIFSRDVKRNDILTIKLPEALYFKRLIGLPGEILEIRDSRVYINGKELPELPGFTFNYNHEDLGTVSLPLSETPAMLQKNRIVKGAETVAEQIFPRERIFDWNSDNYGPVLLPSSGMSVRLDTNNYLFLRQIIIQETGKKLVYQDTKEQFLLSGEAITAYTFRHDYYFLMGDNRNNSYDSRFFGPVPAHRLEGVLWHVF